MVALDGVGLLKKKVELLVLVVILAGAGGLAAQEAQHALERDFLIITARATSVTTLTPFQLQRIYLGRLDRLEGQTVRPLHLKAAHPARGSFDSALFGPDFNLDNYWLTQKLKAGARPPFTLGSQALMLAFIERNPGFVGYVQKSFARNLDKFKVKVISIKP